MVSKKSVFLKNQFKLKIKNFYFYIAKTFVLFFVDCSSFDLVSLHFL